MKKFTADFETATWLEDEAYVWAWATCEIGNTENLKIGTKIDEFIKYCKEEKNSTWYFHNLKFDGEFIIYYLLQNGFKHVEKKEEIEDKTFTTLISDMGQFYQITVYFRKTRTQTIKATFIDSLKIIPFSVADTAKAFNLDYQKLELDYNRPRRRGYILKSYEREYIKHDVLIMAKALEFMFNDNLTKMTIGSNALTDFKKILSNSKFEHLFPELEKGIDNDLRQSYKRRIYIFKPYL